MCGDFPLLNIPKHAAVNGSEEDYVNEQRKGIAELRKKMRRILYRHDNLISRLGPEANSRVHIPSIGVMGFVLTKRIHVSQLQKESPICVCVCVCVLERERESAKVLGFILLAFCYIP